MIKVEYFSVGRPDHPDWEKSLRQALSDLLKGQRNAAEPLIEHEHLGQVFRVHHIQTRDAQTCIDVTLTIHEKSFRSRMLASRNHCVIMTDPDMGCGMDWKEGYQTYIPLSLKIPFEPKGIVGPVKANAWSHWNGCAGEGLSLDNMTNAYIWKDVEDVDMESGNHEQAWKLMSDWLHKLRNNKALNLR